MINEKQGYTLVYDYKKDPLFLDVDFILSVQKISSDKNDPFGLSDQFGLPYSKKWWENIEKGNIEIACREGTILDLNRQNSFVDENTVMSIQLDCGLQVHDGSVLFNDKKDFSLYKHGAKVIECYILAPNKNPKLWNPFFEDKLGVSAIIYKIYIKPID